MVWGCEQGRLDCCAGTWRTFHTEHLLSRWATVTLKRKSRHAISKHLWCSLSCLVRIFNRAAWLVFVRCLVRISPEASYIVTEVYSSFPKTALVRYGTPPWNKPLTVCPQSSWIKTLLHALDRKYLNYLTRWFKYDRDKLWLVYTQIVPVIFEPPCSIWSMCLWCVRAPACVRVHV
jgi:hypothetical protein